MLLEEKRIRSSTFDIEIEIVRCIALPAQPLSKARKPNARDTDYGKRFTNPAGNALQNGRSARIAGVAGVAAGEHFLSRNRSSVGAQKASIFQRRWPEFARLMAAPPPSPAVFDGTIFFFFYILPKMIVKNGTIF